MNGVPSRRPTLADVARLAGMSTAAVSMILNDRPGSRLSADAVERVRAAAEELGYRPNPAAQSLRLGRTRTIGFVSDQVTLTRYASAMIGGVLEAARAHGRTVLMAETGRGGEMAEAVEEMTDRRVDGLLIGLMAARLIDVPQTPPQLPVVLVNGVSPEGHACVLPDERRAGAAVVEHLVEHGHRRIGIVGDLPAAMTVARASATIDQRFAGIADALERTSITPVRVAVPGWSPQVGYEYGGRLLDAHPELTAVIAGTDGVALGIFQAAAERGLRIPDDLSVVSFDDEELATYLRPGLTTARLPYEEMGRLGVEMLLGAQPAERTLLPMPLVVRGSACSID
ncbi:MAG: LacI family DNA-binding transcriptional regulator [Leucobacter sp.]